jgi:hypothetical protein
VPLADIAGPAFVQPDAIAQDTFFLNLFVR